MTAAAVLAAYPELAQESKHENVEQRLLENGGTGLQQPPNNLRNAIMFGFTLQPRGIWKSSFRVRFDIARRMDSQYETRDASGAVIDPATNQGYTHQFPFPDLLDAANDAPNNQSESQYPDNGDRMYSYDPPGLPDVINFDGIPAIGQRTLFANFEEFVRVGIGRPATNPFGGSWNTTTGEQEPVLEGSRASDKLKWSVRHTLVSDGTKLVRSTGNDAETEANNVKEGHQ